MTTIFCFIANLFQAKPNRFFLISGVEGAKRGERERGGGRLVNTKKGEASSTSKYAFRWSREIKTNIRGGHNKVLL